MNVFSVFCVSKGNKIWDGTKNLIFFLMTVVQYCIIKTMLKITIAFLSESLVY